MKRIYNPAYRMPILIATGGMKDLRSLPTCGRCEHLDTAKKCKCYPGIHDPHGSASSECFQPALKPKKITTK